MNYNPLCMCGHYQQSHRETGCVASISRGPMRDNNDHDDDCDCKRSPATVALESVARTIEYSKCKIHPRYQAKRKPRLACEACWSLWFKVKA